MKTRTAIKSGFNPQPEPPAIGSSLLLPAVQKTLVVR